MKASIAALTGMLLLAGCPWALAASSVDLAVTGAITPSACLPSISNDGTVDYGKISMQDLNEFGTELPQAAFKLAVSCDSPSLFGLYSIDNNHPDGGIYFAMGFTGPNWWIANFSLKIKNVIADNQNFHAIYSGDNGASWNGYPTIQSWDPRTLLAFTKTFAGELAPTPVKDVSMEMLVSPVIFSKHLIPTGETISLDGSATLELRYL